MTTIVIKRTNPATKRSVEVWRGRATYARPHGRPRNAARRLKVRALPLRQEGV